MQMRKANDIIGLLISPSWKFGFGNNLVKQKIHFYLILSVFILYVTRILKSYFFNEQ